MIFGSQWKQCVDPDADFGTSIFNFASVCDFEDIEKPKIKGDIDKPKLTGRDALLAMRKKARA